MILFLIFLALGLGSASWLYLGLGLYADWWWFFVPILATFGFFWVCFLLHIVLLFLTSFLINGNKERTKANRFAMWMIHDTCFVLLIFLRVKVSMKGFDKLPKDKPFVIVSNHLSMFDQIVMLGKLRTTNIICISKPENFHIPIAGKWIQLAGYIAINRDNMAEGVSAIEKAKSYLRQGTSIYVCPEGKRAKDHELQPFHHGTFRLVCDEGFDLAVCAIRGTWRIKEGVMLFAHHVYYELIDHIEGAKLKGRATDEVAEASHNAIAEYLAGWLI